MATTPRSLYYKRYKLFNLFFNVSKIRDYFFIQFGRVSGAPYHKVEGRMSANTNVKLKSAFESADKFIDIHKLCVRCIDSSTFLSLVKFVLSDLGANLKSPFPNLKKSIN